VAHARTKNFKKREKKGLLAVRSKITSITGRKLGRTPDPKKKEVYREKVLERAHNRAEVDNSISKSTSQTTKFLGGSAHEKKRVDTTAGFNEGRVGECPHQTTAASALRETGKRN